MEIQIKCQGVDNEYVTIAPDSLPDNAYDVIYLLKVEYAPRLAWLQVASAYFSRGAWATGIVVLEQATSDDVETILRRVEAGAAPACSRLELLAALGGAHIMLADTQRADPVEREKTLRKARATFSLADKIDFDAAAIWVARGWADFLAGKDASAKDWFDNARGKQVVLGSIGLAALLLNRPPRAAADLSARGPDPSARGSDGLGGDAVALLVAALRARRCPPGVWTGLGYALFREGHFSHARDVAARAVRAVTRAAAPERREALYLVALIEAADHKPNSPEVIAAALREAYVECAGFDDPRILALLADLHFKGGDFAKAEVFARQAVARAHDPPSPSVGGMYAGVQRNIYVQALFQFGRALHHLNRTTEAIKAFEKLKAVVDSPKSAALKVNPGFYLRFGMLKLSTGRKEDEAVAEECLEKVLKISGERSYAAMRALGFLLGRRILLNLRGGKTRGGDLFQRAVKLLKTGLGGEKAGDSDIPSQLVYAALVEESSPEISLKAYEKAIAASKEKDIAVDPEIWCNMAAILARMGRHEEAQKVFDEHVDEEFVAGCPTILYNLGRLAEMLGADERAESHFKKLTVGEPHHMEAQVRLGLIAKNRGNIDEAEAVFKKAMADPNTRSIGATYLSNLYESQKKFPKAQDILEKNRGDCDYLSLSFAQFMHRFLDNVGTPERRRKFLIYHVGTPVLNVLKKSKHNAFAANAAGVYLAESGMIDEARDAFSAAGSCKMAAHAARINLAHTQIYNGRKLAKSAMDHIGRPNLRVLASAKSHFEQAEKLYRDALKLSEAITDDRGYSWRVELMHYLACAQYESRDYATAVQTFQKVLMFTPGSNIGWHNLGLALYENAASRIKSTKDLKEVLKAKSEMETSKRCFHRALTLERKHTDPVAHTKFDSKLAEVWYGFVRQESKRHDVTVVNARNEAEDREQRLKEKNRKIAEAMRREEEKKQKLLEEEAKKRRELEEAARSAAEKLVRAEEAEREERMLREQRGNRRGDAYDSDDGERAPPKPRKRRRKTEPVLDSEDEGARRKKRTPAKSARKSRARIARTGGDSSSDEYHDDLDVEAEMDALLEKYSPKGKKSPKEAGSPRDRESGKGTKRKIIDEGDSSEDEVRPVKKHAGDKGDKESSS